MYCTLDIFSLTIIQTSADLNLLLVGGGGEGVEDFIKDISQQFPLNATVNSVKMKISHTYQQPQEKKMANYFAT